MDRGSVYNPSEFTSLPQRTMTAPAGTTRRGFLGLSGLAVTGLAAGGLLTGCTTAAETKSGAGAPVALIPS